MHAQTTRAHVTMLAFLATSVLLAACGSGSGSGSGSGGSGGSGGSSTTTATSTGTTTTTDTAAGCLALCPVLNKCPEITPADCATDCPGLDTLNETAMCTTPYEAMVACILASDDPCVAANNECTDDAAAYVGCTTDYCAANPSTPGCQ